jgi:hypothetical protein
MLAVYTYFDANGIQRNAESNAFNFVGTWTRSGTYSSTTLDTVNYSNGQFTCIINNYGSIPANSSAWSPLVLRIPASGTGVDEALIVAEAAYSIAVIGTNAAAQAQLTANTAFSIAVIGTNTGSSAYALAATADAVAQEALSIAIIGTNIGTTAYSIATTGSNAVYQGYTLSGIVIATGSNFASLGFTPPPNTRLINTAAPLDGGGDLSADRTISITQSGTNTDGYLSSTDWITFETASTNASAALLAAGAASAIASTGTNTANEALSIAIIGTDVGTNAYTLATTGSNTAWEALSIAIIGTNAAAAAVQPARNINTNTPLSGGGDLSADRTLSITQSGSNTSGYLSNTDWGTFNAKVTTTRAINTNAPLTGGGDLSADRTLSITQSGSNTDGYLSSTDWGTFNAKQNSLGNLNGIIKGNGSNTYTVATSGTDYAPGYSGVPVGGIIAWAKSLTNTPALPIGYVECNGQTLSDANSVYNGIVIPNLNGSTDATKRFLRGATTSGGTGGSATHTHSVGSATDNHFITSASPIATAVTSISVSTGSASTIPTYYEVVYVMRVK